MADLGATWRRGALGSGLVIAGCAFSSPGNGQGSGNLGDGGDGTSAGEATGDEGSTAGAGDDAEDVGDGTMGPPGVDESDGDSGPSVIGGALVVFTATSPVDLGDVDLAAGQPLPALELRNDGEVAATGLSAASPVPPLSWAGGAFPGTGGTCGAELLPDQSCTVVLAPLPEPIGLSSQVVTVDYLDSGVSEQAAMEIMLGGIGKSENLLQNGGFEDGASGAAPPGWTPDGGSWAAAGNGYDSPQSGYAGAAPYSTEIRLWQEVDLGQWASTLDAVGMGYEVQGYAHTLSGDSDVWRVVITEVAGDGVSLWSGATEWVDTNGWTAFSHAASCQPATRRIRVDLQCYKNYGTDCSAWFDTVSVRAVYPPPG